MKKCYVVGSPIKHSLSPAIFNYLFKKNNINAKYFKYNPENETDFLKFIKNENFYGLNITLPYKKSAYKIIKNQDDHVANKSINCIMKNKESLTGYNTDEYGFLKMIEKLNLDFSNYNILILGNGGSALTISNVLLNNINNKLFLWGRNKNNVTNFIQKLSSERVKPYEKKTNEPLIVISCISLDIDKSSANSILNNISYNNIKLFIDINYVKTNLSLIIKNKNIDIVLGKAMFIYQALKTYEIWFGQHNSSYNDIKRLLDK